MNSSSSEKLRFFSTRRLNQWGLTMSFFIFLKELQIRDNQKSRGIIREIYGFEINIKRNKTNVCECIYAHNGVWEVSSVCYSALFMRKVQTFYTCWYFFPYTINILSTHWKDKWDITPGRSSKLQILFCSTILYFCVYFFALGIILKKKKHFFLNQMLSKEWDIMWSAVIAKQSEK